MYHVGELLSLCEENGVRAVLLPTRGVSLVCGVNGLSRQEHFPFFGSAACVCDARFRRSGKIITQTPPFPIFFTEQSTIMGRCVLFHLLFVSLAMDSDGRGSNSIQ